MLATRTIMCYIFSRFVFYRNVSMAKTVGICLGASSLSLVMIEDDTIIKTQKIVHNGDPNHFLQKCVALLSDDVAVVVTGRKFRNSTKYYSISESVATECALKWHLSKYAEDQNATSVATLGAETFMVYHLDKEKHIKNVKAKNKCASGTGEFFLQQIKRMSLSLDEATSIANATEPYLVSGRCSVFCKSDCTHALNIGVPKANVTAGLAKMIAEKIEEILPADHSEKIFLVGGLTKNNLVMKYISQSYPNIIIPAEADYFEALGAAVYAADNPHNSRKRYQVDLHKSVFTTLPPIKDYSNRVTFHQEKRRNIVNGERCILGVDVGSTTTKAVIMAVSDNAILSDCYLYTNGDPITAARECYKKLLNDTDTCDLRIVGVGTTGSGRNIAGLHAQTDGVFNEITAHCAAAVFYDPKVDTIFEIGGQDAKYSYIVNRIPSDYAMNEACSAGTGSFIEEAAFESLGVKVTELETLALQGQQPPNFSDQCSAFISSDIKQAQQEGIAQDDIIAGLTYSICYNYVNRVKGNRPVGKKVFMQGGVCYNKSIPIAMAGVADADISVPPNPGLMGAFGVALVVAEKLQLGLLKEKKYSLQDLIHRNVIHHKSFICAGGVEKCDLKCKIAMIEVDGKKYPFGGACEKYNNHQTHTNQGDNYVALRNEIIFGDANLII
jgi:predicted CoA-substrate-specific enzyme activase